jgi:hypothetical protein
LTVFLLRLWSMCLRHWEQVTRCARGTSTRRRIEVFRRQCNRPGPQYFPLWESKGLQSEVRMAPTL